MNKYLLLLLLALNTHAVTLTQLEGSPLPSEDKMQGKVVLVDFWASWCGPCRKSFPWLNLMQQQHAADGLLILAVNEDQNRADAAAFLAKYPAQFNVLYDQNGEVATRYKVNGMPSSYLIDKKGNIRFAHRGFKQADIDTFEQQIRQLLAEE